MSGLPCGTTLARLCTAAWLAVTPALAQAPEPQLSLLRSPAELARELGTPGVVLVQVERDSVAYAEGHISGARLLRLGQIVVDRNGIPNELPEIGALTAALEGVGISQDSRVMIYGDPLGAARLFFTLDYLGLGDRAALLDGGLAAWRAEGRPVTAEPSPAMRGHLTPAPRPGLLVDADWVHARLGDSTVVLLDARPPSDFEGRTGGEGLPKAGHIPGAQNLFWRFTLNSPEPRTLKPTGVLQALFRRAGAAPGKALVTYCRTGVQASYLYFVARYLGYAPRMYDGSFSDWSRHADLPVAP